MDLDGTLAEHDKWQGVAHIGPPVPAMYFRVERWLAEGRDVRIFTARVAEPSQEQEARKAIDSWCEQLFGHTLPITCVKDHKMIELWDDRAVGVIKNTGEPTCPSPAGLE